MNSDGSKEGRFGALIGNQNSGYILCFGKVFKENIFVDNTGD